MPDTEPKTLDRHNKAAPNVNPTRSGVRTGNPQLDRHAGSHGESKADTTPSDSAPHAPAPGTLQSQSQPQPSGTMAGPEAEAPGDRPGTAGAETRRAPLVRGGQGEGMPPEAEQPWVDKPDEGSPNRG
jgi:hypothetical protein